MLDADRHRAAALSREISALCRAMRSRKRADIAARPTTAARLETLRAERAAITARCIAAYLAASAAPAAGATLALA